jgi:Amt family ammonium transporter
LGSNLPLATLGTFILWFGWLGFNGGSQLALGSAADAIAIGNIYVNTMLASAAGVVAVLVITLVRYGKIDLTMVLNGALGGLVAITAEPLAPSPGLSVLIGVVGGLLVAISVPIMDSFKLDDVVGAVPVHLVSGIWGTLAVVFSNAEASVAAIGAFVVVTTSVLWLLIKVTMGLRVDEQQEFDGLDLSECGQEGYPDFARSQ